MMYKCERCGYKLVHFQNEKYCTFCKKEIEKERIQNLIRSGIENVNTKSEDFVFCPYCGKAINTNYSKYDFPEIYTDGSYMLTCPECDMDFSLETHVFYAFSTYKINKNKK